MSDETSDRDEFVSEALGLRRVQTTGHVTPEPIVVRDAMAPVSACAAR